MSSAIIDIRLNRPERGNAFDRQAVDSLTRQFRTAASDRRARLIILSGEGADFCTGADLNWMEASGKMSPRANRTEAESLARMYEAILSSPLPVLAMVQGRVLGGGVGLVAACDIVACGPRTTFALPEARWGLIPGVITPIVIRKIGYSRFLEYALTGRPVTAKESLAAGLVHFVGAERGVNAYLTDCAERIEANASDSLLQIKKMTRRLSGVDSRVLAEMASLTAMMRKQPEAQKRLSKRSK